MLPKTKISSVSAYVHMRHDTLSLFTQLYLFWMTLPSPVAYLLNGWPLSEFGNIKWESEELNIWCMRNIPRNSKHPLRKSLTYSIKIPEN